MRKEKLIQYTISNIKKLPENKISEVNDYIEFLLSKIENQLLSEEVQKTVSTSKSYDFLEQDPELYSLSDIKSKYK
ncbi:MAG: hypothetical protein K0R65_1856 [Crocinitomicaceae bacterium]|jgi:hypothetical protein|nr:hypothetical protein [Crocinitomicaceae bacterium]